MPLKWYTAPAAPAASTSLGPAAQMARMVALKSLGVDQVPVYRATVPQAPPTQTSLGPVPPTA